MTLLKFLLVFFPLGVAAWAALFTWLVLRREDGGLPGRMFDRMHDWAMSEPGDGEAWRPTSCS